MVSLRVDNRAKDDFVKIVERQDIKYLLYNEVLGSLENEEPIEADSLEDALSQVLSNMGYSIIEAEKRKEE